MDFDPQKFFIGVIDFFSVLLPGALLTFLFSEQLGPFFLNNRYAALNDSSRWMVFLFSSYLLGHFIFLLGSFLMDDHVYDRIRQATASAQIKRLAKGKRRAWWPTRRLANWLVSEQSDAAVDRATRIKQHYVSALGAAQAINTFQWCKARLALSEHQDANATVLRYEADSKFFRSFAVVLCVVAIWAAWKTRFAMVCVAIVLLLLSTWRFIDQRSKATNQAYWYVITLEAENVSNTAYRQPRENPPGPSHAGGVVYRYKAGEVLFLLIQATINSTEWILPKGHIELEESMKETAVREVVEETGIWARVEVPLDEATFQTGEHPMTVKFYLMQRSGVGKKTESRDIQWLSFDDARLLLRTESQHLLDAAQRVLTTPDRRRRKR